MHAEDGTRTETSSPTVAAELFDPAAAGQREAKRQLKLLGPLAGDDCQGPSLRERARAVLVPATVLATWLRAYRSQGLTGLTPNWEPLREKAQQSALAIYLQLGELAEAEAVNKEQIAALAERNGWKIAKAERWVRRYRVAGLWGLAPRRKGHRARPAKEPKRDLATLDEATLDKAAERLRLLGDLAEKDSLTEAEVETQANKVGRSPRSIRYYHQAYRKNGLVGLASDDRSDHGAHRGLSPRMRDIIVGLWLRAGEQSVSNVHPDACATARNLDEPEPTVWQVRSVGDAIPEPVKLLARGRTKEFQNRYGFTIRMLFEGIIYLIDHTQIDVLVRDRRRPGYRAASGEVRPWLTLVMDAQSRLVMAAIFGYDHPDRLTVAAAIRDALLVSERKPCGGTPNEIWVDHGKELLSQHVHQLCKGLGIKLRPCHPHHPQTKGIVERFFGTLNTRLWSKMDGYVGSNTTERPDKVRAKLTLSELVTQFWGFIGEYHTRVHSATKKTPLAYWDEYCVAEPVDPRELDILLMESDVCRVLKGGIRYKNRIYWHTDLASLVGQDVLIRAGPTYEAPDEIEVFHNDRWVCTAFVLDSAARESVTRREIVSAQKRQKDEINRQIADARRAVADANQEIAARNQEEANPSSPPPSSSQPVQAERRKSPRKPKRKDLLDRMSD